MKRKDKRSMVLDVYDREAMGEVTAREIALINQALVAEFGEGGAMDPGEIARILVNEDLPVRFEQIFRMATLRERYENLFTSLPGWATLATAKKSLYELDAHYRRFLERGDKTGVRYARQTARDGRTETTRAAADKRNDAHRRLEQAEIAQWIKVWLETPDLFDQWLALRQATVEFRQRFETKT
jgi:hypothetical protein